MSDPRLLAVAKSWTKFCMPLVEGTPPGAFDAARLFLAMLDAAIECSEPVSALSDLDTVLIWSGEYQAWWRPEGRGYTTLRDEAGRFSFCDARARTAHLGPEKKIAFTLETPSARNSSPDLMRVPAWIPIDDHVKNLRYWIVRRDEQMAIARFTGTFTRGTWWEISGTSAQLPPDYFTHYLPIELPEPP